MSKVFDVSIFGSIEADSLAAMGFGLLFLGLSSRVKASKVVFVILFVVASGAYVADRSELVIGALVILPAIGALLITAAVADRKDPPENRTQRLSFDGKRVAGAFLLIIIFIEAGALGRWIAYPATGGEIYGDPSWKFAELESALFHSLGLLSPVLVVLLAFSFLYRWYILNGLKRIGQALFPASDETRQVKEKNDRIPPQHRPSQFSSQQYIESPANSKDSAQVLIYAATNTLTSKHLHRGLLALALVVAPLLMIYPHLPMINPRGEGVSTDEVYYTNWMTELRKGISTGDGTWTNILWHSFTVNNGDRPVTLLLILAISNLTGFSDLIVMRFLPVALSPALVVANYLLLRHALDAKQYGINRIKVFAAIGSVLAVFSPQVVVGEYAGFLANWLALIAAYFAFYFMIKGWESSDRNRIAVSFVALFGVLLLTMVIHLYTWAHLLTIILGFSGVSYLLSRRSVNRPRTKVLLMLLVVFTSFAVDNARSFYFNTPSAVASDSALATDFQANDPAGRWERLYFTLSSYVGGFISNPVLFLLALIWTVKSRYNGLNALMMTITFMVVVPVLIGSVEFQTRVLHNTPIHIAAVLALVWTGNRLGRKNDDKNLQKLLIVGILFLMANYALRAMANLPIELPAGIIL